jgi:hypothetical protein
MKAMKNMLKVYFSEKHENGAFSWFRLVFGVKQLVFYD